LVPSVAAALVAALVLAGAAWLAARLLRPLIRAAIDPENLRAASRFLFDERLGAGRSGHGLLGRQFGGVEVAPPQRDIAQEQREHEGDQGEDGADQEDG